MTGFGVGVMVGRRDMIGLGVTVGVAFGIGNMVGVGVKITALKVILSERIGNFSYSLPASSHIFLGKNIF